MFRLCPIVCAQRTDVVGADAHSAPPLAGLLLASDLGVYRARQTRAVELAELLADALAFAQRLTFVVEGDVRADSA